MKATLNSGTLTISTIQSAEEMPNYAEDNSTPWNVNDILNVVIKDNVTSIGFGTFTDCH